MLQSISDTWNSLSAYGQHTVWTTVWTLAITVALILSVALLTLWERKVIGWMQLRRGPNRVRILGMFPGLGQPFADVVKLLTKEVIIPANANKFLFLLAPMITLIPAFAAWAVIPLSATVVVSKANAGLLYLLSLTSMGVYGVMIAGWAANSKYAFLGAMRSAAQMVAYEIAMGFALVGVIIASQSLNLGDIVERQQEQKPVGVGRNDHFLGEQLQDIREGLTHSREHTEDADAVRAAAQLHPSDDLSFPQRRKRYAENEDDGDGNGPNSRPHGVLTVGRKRAPGV